MSPLIEVMEMFDSKINIATQQVSRQIRQRVKSETTVITAVGPLGVG